jgi:hypothetical protein
LFGSPKHGRGYKAALFLFFINYVECVERGLFGRNSLMAAQSS